MRTRDFVPIGLFLTLAGCGWLEKKSAEHRRNEEATQFANESECAAGWGWACGQAGWAFDSGEGARWLTRGCEPPDPRRADAQSCSRLGVLFAEGRGVAQDLGRAQALLKKACDSGYENACRHLAKYRGGPPATGS